MTRRRRRTAGLAAGLAIAVLAGGCATSHLATSTARDGIGAGTPSTGPSNPPPTTQTGPSPTTPTASTPTGDGLADFRAIRQLMSRRAAAVVSDNEVAFLRSVDRAGPAFVQAQRVLFENLHDLPVTAMSYEVGNGGLANAEGITGGQLLSPEVIEHVFLSGTDLRPVSNRVNDTFVKRNGAWRLAADTVGATGVTARPWEGARIDVVIRGHLIVVADAASGKAASLADTVQADLSFDADVLDVALDDHLLVDATTSGSVSQFANHESAGAVTFPVFASKDFEGTRLAGYRVKVNPDYIDYLANDPTLLRHELTHYLTFKFSGRTPIWLTEGLAEYVSHQPGGLATEYMTSEEYDRLIHRPQVLTVSGLFGEDPHTDYPLAMACVTYLVNQGGIDKIKQLMSAYLTHNDGPYEDQWTRLSLRQVFGLTPADVAHGAFGLLDALR